VINHLAGIIMAITVCSSQKFVSKSTNNFFLIIMNIKFLLAAILTSFTLTTQAQSNVIKIQPLALINSTLSVGYEHKLTDSRSFQINADYASETDFGFRSTWLGISAEYRLYGLIDALKTNGQICPEGFFVAPTAGVRFFKDVDLDSPNSSYTERYNFIQLGALAGYQWLPNLKNGKKKLTLEGSVGLLGGFMLTGKASNYSDYALGSRFGIGLIPALNISVGYAFGQ
jgi:hypothetical protein